MTFTVESSHHLPINPEWTGSKSNPVVGTWVTYVPQIGYILNVNGLVHKREETIVQRVAKYCEPKSHCFKGLCFLCHMLKVSAVASADSSGIWTSPCPLKFVESSAIDGYVKPHMILCFFSFGNIDWSQ
ncbi:hypothetical protein VNO77_05364 [Canavalia gladiata]|uniref:Uncharacterized protein n=1 Tax=Canavalia gladiata TaxID=3824 RepID=A0AAN9R5L3_CANGL